jgi:hypothetical protein
MKRLILAFILFSSPTLAQVQVPSRQDFNLSQPTQDLNLEGREFETIYRTDYVPDTCFRSEIQGTRPECHTEYDRQCYTRYQQQCGLRPYPVCQMVPRNVCSTQQVCQTVNDRICNPRGCSTRPRRECRIENRCSTRMEQVCHTQQRYECQTLPQTLCQNVPRQVCIHVPNVVQVPYSCQKPVQVAVGQNLKLKTVAKVTLRFVSFSETGSNGDRFTAALEGDQIKFTAQSSNYLYQIVDQTRSERMLSSTEKSIEAVFSIKATSLKGLSDFGAILLDHGTLGPDRLSFRMSAQPLAPYKGHLNLVQHRRFARDLIIVDRDFDSRLLVAQGADHTLLLSPLGATGLRDKTHTVKLSLMLDGEMLRKGAVNPEILSQIKNQQIELNFEASPNEKP